MLEGDLAQDHIPSVAPLERSPHRERAGVDGNAMTVKGTDAMMLSCFPYHVPISQLDLSCCGHKTACTVDYPRQRITLPGLRLRDVFVTII